MRSRGRPHPLRSTSCNGNKTPQLCDSGGGPAKQQSDIIIQRIIRHLQLPPPPCLPMPPSLLQSVLDEILVMVSPTLSKPCSLQFEWSPQAAAKNQEVLASFDWDLGRALADQGQSPLAPGSEFRLSILRPLCGRHPLWPNVAKWFSSASQLHSNPSPRQIAW
jgi:hypothetical protein